MWRPIETIEYSSSFLNELKKLPTALRGEIAEREKIFRSDCFDPRLKTHKLHGSQKDVWSFYITFRHRILFRFTGHRTVEFLDVGDHSVYE